MFTAMRQLQVQGTQAAFINYVVCLAVVQGIKEATQQLLKVSITNFNARNQRQQREHTPQTVKTMKLGARQFSELPPRIPATQVE